MTRDEWIEKMDHQKILNGRVFDTDILTKLGMETLFDVVFIQEWNHLFEPPAPYLHEPEVYDFCTEWNCRKMVELQPLSKIKIYLDEKILGIILVVPMVGIWTIEGCKPTREFMKLATKWGDIKRAGLPKKLLKGEYLLVFEFINKVLVPRKKKWIVTSTADLFMMEKLVDLEEINLPAIMPEHMHNVMTWNGPNMVFCMDIC